MDQDVLKYIIIVPIIAWLIISPIIAAYLHFFPNVREDFHKSHKTITATIYLGFFIAGLIIISNGIEYLLSFVPESWGWIDNESEYVTLRRFLSYMFGFFIMGYLVFLFEQYDNYRKQNNRRRIELTAHRKIGSRSELKKYYQKRLEEIAQNKNFDPNEEEEKAILIRLLLELE